MRSKFHVWLQISGSFIYQVFTVWYSLCVGNWFLTLNSTTGDANSLPILPFFGFIGLVQASGMGISEIHDLDDLCWVEAIPPEL